MSGLAPSRAGEMQSYLDRLGRVAPQVSVPDLVRVAQVLEAAYVAEATIFTCGNGGSAATASHFATDLGKNTHQPGAPRVRALSLVDAAPTVTAWANDAGYAAVFVGQLEGLLRQGDVLVAFSTSGNSPNVVAALRYTRAAAGTTVGFLGPDGGEARQWCDAAVLVPAAGIDEQEDLHLVLAHILTRHLRAVARGRGRSAGSQG